MWAAALGRRGRGFGSIPDGGAGAESAPCVERPGGQEIDGGEQDVKPDEGAEEVLRGDPAGLNELEMRGDSEDDGSEKETGHGVGDGADEGHAALDAGGWTGTGEGEDTARGEKQDTAEIEREPGSRQGAGDLPEDDGEDEKEPEGEATKDISLDVAGPGQAKESRRRKKA